MDLSERIIQQIREQGPMAFCDFMEMCLYDPDQGYYTTMCESIGQQGDFYTSPTLSAAFGATIGKQLEVMWTQMGKGAFTIVEYGAGTGHLCNDILNYFRGHKQMNEGMRYCIIEKSPVLRSMAQRHLPDQVEWYDSIAEIGEIQGCILSNELVDNFAVHRVVMRKKLMEVYVDYQDGFAEHLRPAGSEVINYLAEMEISLPEGYCAEINLQAVKWITEVATNLNSGYIITIDYGDENSTMYKSSRAQGTLMCYRNHSTNGCLYEHIGKQDITSHVNFSALRHWGAKAGLKDTGIINQGEFLHALGFREYLLKSLESEKNILQAARKAARISHILLVDMGYKYKVLIQEKG